MILTDEDVCKLTEGIVEMAKDAVRENRSAMATFIVTPKDKAQKAIVMAFPQWDTETKPMIKMIIGSQAVDNNAEMVTFVCDSWSVDYKKAEAYYKLKGTAEQIKERIDRIQDTEWKGSLGNAPAAIRQEAVLISSKGPDIPNFMQLIPYTRSPDGAVTFEKTTTMESHIRLEINVIPSWWESPERYKGLFTAMQKSGGVKSIEIPLD
jgi:hypothetical protein